jgi:ribosome modulation factor
MSTNNQPDLLAEVVAWDMRGVSEVPVCTVRNAIVSAGITCDVPELRATTAFNRATKPLKADANVIRGRKKCAKSKGAPKSYAIHRVSEDYGDLEYLKRADVTLDAATGRVSCPDEYELERTLQQGVREAMETRTQSDITRIVQNLFDSQAELYPLVPSKGVAYIVPSAFRDFVAKVERFVNSLGGTLVRVAVPKGDQVSNRNFAEAVEQGLAAMIEEVKSVAEGWTDKTRESTVERHLAKLDQVIFRAECYAEHLGAQQAKLIEAVKRQREECQARLAAMMTPDESDDDDEPETAPVTAVPVDQIKRARIEGWDACENGEVQNANPYVYAENRELFVAWDAGWQACHETADEEEAVEVV